MATDPFALQGEATTHEKSSTNKLIRSTYMLLSMTLLFSAVTAGIAMATGLKMHWLMTLVGIIGLFFITSKLRNSVWGLAAVFALTGFMGLSLGGVVDMYLARFVNGSELVMMAFGSTAVIFLTLSGYVLTTKKDFSFMAGFLMVGMIVAILGSVGAMFFNVPGLQLAISGAVVLLMAGFILYDTSNIVNGHETNYIMATVSLYLNIYNMFLSLLAIFGIWGDD
jgi:modulator of FtsH protease